MRADRLLSALLLLQAHRRLTGRALAERLEVSPRTVHRDMEALAAAGVPVFALRGARGGWALEPGWTTSVPGLDDAEVRALLMAQPRVLGDRPLAAAAERALAKLVASLPRALRERAATMRERLYVDPHGWRGTAEDLSMLPLVQDAVARDRKLAMRYRSAGREAAERTVSPLGLVAKASAWYLVALAAAGLRTYRVSRIESALVLDDPAERPAGFDLAAYWTSSNDRFDRERRQYPATLRIEPGAARRLQMFQRTTMVDDVTADDRLGWPTLIAHFDREEEALFVVLGLGPNVDVIAPDRLRQLVLQSAVAVVGRIRSPGA